MPPSPSRSPTARGTTAFTAAAIFISILALTCFAVASFSCTTFRLQDEDSFSFGFWKRQSPDGSCTSFDETVDDWLKFGRIAGITGCQLGFATVLFFGVAHGMKYTKDTVVKVGYSALIGASFLSISLLLALQTSFCRIDGLGQCRVNLKSTGILIFLSVLFYGIAGIVLYWMDGADTETNHDNPPEESAPSATAATASRTQTPSGNNRNPTSAFRDAESQLHPVTVAEDSTHQQPADNELVVETIQEPDGSKMKRTTKRYVQSDGSKVVQETTEILKRPTDAVAMSGTEPDSWTTMVVETVSKRDGCTTKTTSKTFDDPDDPYSKIVQRTVEISEKKLRSMADVVEILDHLGSNGKAVEIDTVRQADGSHVKTTTTTTRLRSNMFMVERVVEISERGVRSTSSTIPMQDPSLPPVESTDLEEDVALDLPPTSQYDPDDDDDDDDDQPRVNDSPGGGVEESKDEHNEKGHDRV